MTPDIEIVERRGDETAVVRGRVPHGEVGPFIGQAFGQVLAVVGPGNVVGPPFCRIDMTGDEFDLEVGFPVPDPIEGSGAVVPSSLPAGTVATAMHVGPYEQVAGLYFAIETWMGEHGYEPTGAPWETYLDGPDVAAPRTIVSWPCRRT